MTPTPSPSTTSPHTHVRLSDLSELIAGIPGLIGYPPTESVVVFTFRSTQDLWLSTTMRGDLPTPDMVPLAVDQLLAAATQNSAVAAIAVVIGGDPTDPPSHRPMVAALRAVFEAAGIAMVHASWVREVAHGEQWHCYEDPLCGGTVPDPKSSTVAAAITLAGGVTFPSKAALARQLAADDPKTLARREKLLDEHMEKAGLYTQEALAQDLRTVRAEITKAARTRNLPTLSDKRLVRMAMALSQPEVRDECLTIALSAKADAAERLWTVLTRSLPAPERAEPAYLLAMSCYLRGDGVLAAAALRTALDANQSHAMAALLDKIASHGVPPAAIREMLTTAVTGADPDPAAPSPTETESGEAAVPTEPPGSTAGSAPVVPPPAAAAAPAAEPDAAVPAVGPVCGDAARPVAQPDSTSSPVQEMAAIPPYVAATPVESRRAEATSRVDRPDSTPGPVSEVAAASSAGGASATRATPPEAAAAAPAPAPSSAEGASPASPLNSGADPASPAAPPGAPAPTAATTAAPATKVAPAPGPSSAAAASPIPWAALPGIPSPTTTTAAETAAPHSLLPAAAPGPVKHPSTAERQQPTNALEKLQEYLANRATTPPSDPG